jgi:hypothetical protein
MYTATAWTRSSYSDPDLRLAVKPILSPRLLASVYTQLAVVSTAQCATVWFNNVTLLRLWGYETAAFEAARL